MSLKLFEQVAENQNFTFNGDVYTKIATQKVSCCRSVNATKVSSGERILVNANQEVEISDE